MLQEVWDAIFLGKPIPEGCTVPADVMKRMKDEFKFWYPFDLRVSGKDLIQNHLTFCLYNHTAIFPPAMWPRSFRTNGHLLLNSEKMSKNTGNFKTLRAAIGTLHAYAMHSPHNPYSCLFCCCHDGDQVQCDGLCRSVLR